MIISVLFYSYGFIYLLLSIFARFFSRSIVPPNADLLKPGSHDQYWHKLKPWERASGIAGSIWLTLGAIFTTHRWLFIIIWIAIFLMAHFAPKMDRKPAKMAGIMCDLFTWIVILKILYEVFIIQLQNP